MCGIGIRICGKKDEGKRNMTGARSIFDLLASSVFMTN